MAAMSRHSFNIEPYGSMGFELITLNALTHNRKQVIKTKKNTRGSAH
jgi:hypothetical protein